MTPDRWRRVQEVFAAATERGPEARAAYLDEACRDDPDLRTEVESLLSSLRAAATDFLESPAIEGVPALSPAGQGGPRAVGKGTRLGPYEILAPLGAGGMGEVYRAKDERLGREVAIKVLSAELSEDASRVRRFEKEARSASALNHPNIVTVYEFGSSDGLSYIAMEKVDGETLRKLISSGPVPIKKLLAFAPQIADGLARAHEAGIVHRDLKPENVMVTRDGLVKILDFGLAKLVSSGSGSDEGSKLPNMSATNPGVILGTVGYMSPEQASGERVDFRSDQFSFGSILYEMATGKRAFQGRTPIDVLGAILNDEPPPIAEVSFQTPTPLRWIIERCLSKEPRQRYSSTDDLARDLATLRDHLSEATSGAGVAASRPRRRWVVGLLLAAAALAIAVLGLMRQRAPIAQPRPIRFVIRAPRETGFWGSWAFSPDGSALAFVAAGKDSPKVWLRPMSAMDARPVQGTEKADSVFWSPDGKTLGFFANGKLWRVSTEGGVPAPVCDVARDPFHAGTWGADGQILFSADTGEAIYRVSSAGGTPTALVRTDRARGETQVLWPEFLPDGKRFLYLRRDARGGMLMLAAPDGASRSLFPVLSRADYMEPGYLVFTRGQTLLAQRFDSRVGAVVGEPSSLAEGVAYEMRTAWARFAASRSGAIAYQTQGAIGQARLAWFDRSGKVEEVGRKQDSGMVAIDPAGRRALFSRRRADTMNRNLWILDLEHNVEARVTPDDTNEESGRWLPDGKSIVYSAEVGGLSQLRRRDLDTGMVTALLPPANFQEAGPLMPGGTQLAYTTLNGSGVAEMRLVSLSGDQKSVPFIQAGFNEGGVQISPDGRFIAFARDDAGGRDEIYVAPITNPTQRTRVSFTGVKHGTCLWSRNGKEILYLTFDRRLMSIPIRTEPALSAGEPTVLLTFKEGEDWEYFDVSPDGKRFLAVVPEAAADTEEHPLNVVLNWPAEAAAR